MTDSKDLLKTDICDYLTRNGVVRDLLAKCLSTIKSCAFNEYPIDRDMLSQKQIRDCAKTIGLKEGDQIYAGLCWNFAPRHYSMLAGFVKRLEVILNAEYEAEQELENKICQAIEEEYNPLGEELYDELGCPDFAVLIYSDRIVVEAYQTGVGEMLPRQGRKYIGGQGDMKWQFPLSMRSELERLGRPVVDVAKL